MRSYYEPTDEQLRRLSEPWTASYSGGKDSTTLVTWVEWLRRSGQLRCDRPRLVQSDTGVEDPGLMAVSAKMVAALRASGWECAMVEPKISERLYNRILGIGNTPIFPGVQGMRWCSRSTKIEPMKRWRKSNAGGLTLTGLRLGESAMRDRKIKSSCAAGGECGLPMPDETTYSPILHWPLCSVIDWLQGYVDRSIRSTMGDLSAITRELLAIYDVKVDRNVFEFADPIVEAARFGCVGCPAIQASANAPASSIARYGRESPLNELYDVWFEARRRVNRCWKWRASWTGTSNHGFGPIKLAVRPVLFERVLDIQRRAGVVLVRPVDEEFIRQCWADKVYPRGWSEADESTVPPEGVELFGEDDG